MKLASPILALMLVALVGCQTFYSGVVSLTRIVDDAAHEYAKLHLAGLVPPDVALKASVSHAEYRRAAGVLADALEAVKAGKEVDTKPAWDAARAAANHFVDVLFGILTKARVTELRAQIAKAGAP